jgi:pimeloyl-ACP methyl ester carboxylesterase
MWRPQVEALARAGRPALAIDLPGHGDRIAERFTLPASIDAIGEAVDAVGGRAVVVGLSLGGYLGILHAARRPEQVAGLVAAGCSSTTDQPATTAWLLAARGFARLPDRGAWLNQWLVRTALPPEGARDVAAGGFALDVMVDLLSAMRKVDPLAELRRVTCPVWLVNGQWDHFRLQARTFAAATAQVRVVTVRGATHLVAVVRPVAFTRVLLEVLAEIDAGEGSTQVRRSEWARSTWASPASGAQPNCWVCGRDHARTPPTMPAELGTTTTSSPIAARTAGLIRRAFPPPR